MSTLTKLAARTSVAAIALTAMGILAASPASAAVPVLYTYLENTPVSYGTISAVDGSVTPLSATPSSDPQQLVGQELFNGVGTSIGEISDSGSYDIYDWNATTGAASVGVPAFLTGADPDSLAVTGLDTRLDGTLLTYVQYTTTSGGEFPTATNHTAIATVDRTTGELTPVIDATALSDEGYRGIELATDPISGVTYLFLTYSDDSLSYYSALNFTTSSLDDPPQAFGGTGFEAGFFRGADFDASGTLWFIYGPDDPEQYQLSTVGAPATWPTAARTEIGAAAFNYADFPLSALALTTGPAPLVPGLAKTGAEFPTALLLLGSVAVLAGTVTVVTVSRKRRTA